MKRLVPQKRDIALLSGVYRHGFFLRDHAWKLYFPECALRRANRRLLALTRQDYLVAHVLPLGAYSLGVEGFLPSPGQLGYRLGEAGIPLVADALGLEMTAVRKRLRASPSYLGHAVAVTICHVVLREFQESQDYRLNQFLTEGEARHQFEWRETPTAPWKSAEVRPDALAWIEKSGMSLPLLLEADRATQSAAAFRDKLAGYALYWKTAVFAKRFGNAPLRLLIVTTSPARRDILAALVSESDLSGLPGIALTTFSDFRDQGPLGPIWQVPALGTERNRSDVLLPL